MKGYAFGGLELNEDWIWQGDWNGYEVGFDDLRDTSRCAYLDMETGEILQLVNLEEVVQ